MPNLFHSTSAQLEPRSVVLPGNYGRILALYRNDGSPNGWKVATEIAFESLRALEFPSLPSRLKSCFAYPDLAAAAACRDRMSLLDMLYEVELVSPEAATHIGDFDLMSRCYAAGSDSPFMATLDSASRAYWLGKGTGCKEVVTLSALRIVRAVPWPMHQLSQQFARM